LGEPSPPIASIAILTTLFIIIKKTINL